ncbi:hypothetical protein GBA52_025878 [Prunus armeniaca]|nr:hypothetical protein GBA52_025878 [Prunus armeniaca]
MMITWCCVLRHKVEAVWNSNDQRRPKSLNLSPNLRQLVPEIRDRRSDKVIWSPDYYTRPVS